MVSCKITIGLLTKTLSSSIFISFKVFCDTDKTRHKDIIDIEHAKDIRIVLIFFDHKLFKDSLIAFLKLR